MRSRFYLCTLLLFGAFALPVLSPASVVFRPKGGAKYVAAGDEQINGTAQELFQVAQASENKGDIGHAMKAYKSIQRRYPHDALAAGAAYRYAVLAERRGDYILAANAYRIVAENYPKSANFDEAIEAQFRIGEMYLNGKKLKLLGIPIKASVDRSIEIFAGIVHAAPFGKYTARAQFGIGLANQKIGNAEAAVVAYQAVVDKFPNEPIAADAQYQIGHLWFNSAKSGVKDAKATENAKTGFHDFLDRFPKSEKAAQARQNLQVLEHKETANAFEIAKYYDKQKNYRAAVIYYNDVIREQPGSPQGDRAKQRVAQLRAKVGDAKLQDPALTAATAKPPKSTTAPMGERPKGGHDEAPEMRTSPSDVAPLPPPENDESLPPPASLNPGTTTAPDPSASASPNP